MTPDELRAAMLEAGFAPAPEGPVEVSYELNVPSSESISAVHALATLILAAKDLLEAKRAYDVNVRRPDETPGTSRSPERQALDEPLRLTAWAALRRFRELRGILPDDRVAVKKGLPKNFGQPLAKVLRIAEKTAVVYLLGEKLERRIPVAGLEISASELAVAAADLLELHGIKLSELRTFEPCSWCAEPATTEDYRGRACATHALPEWVTGPRHDPRPIVVIPCSGPKLAHRARAADLYIGSTFVEALDVARTITQDDRIRVLSGRYGFLRLSDIVEPYEQKIDADGAISPAELRAQVDADPELDELRHGRRTAILLLPQAYADGMKLALMRSADPRDVPSGVLDLFGGSRGIGDHRHRLKALRFAGVGSLQGLSDFPADLDEEPELRRAVEAVIRSRTYLSRRPRANRVDI